MERSVISRCTFIRVARCSGVTVVWMGPLFGGVRFVEVSVIRGGVGVSVNNNNDNNKLPIYSWCELIIALTLNLS